MGYVTAGLLSGLGQGLERVATTLEQRRREALEAARSYALEMSRQQARSQERAEDRQATRNNLEFSESQSNLRTAAGLTSQEARNREDNLAANARTRAQIDQRRWEAQFGRETATILENLRSSNDRAEQRLAVELTDRLRSDDVRQIIYGPRRQDGLAEIVLVTTHGMHGTGRFTNPPENRDGIYGSAMGGTTDVLDTNRSQPAPAAAPAPQPRSNEGPIIDYEFRNGRLVPVTRDN